MNAPTLWSVAEAAAATNGQGQGDWRASGVSTDSRTLQQGDLFVAIQGPRFNGHRFAANALERGAAAVMVHERPNDLASDAPVLMVANTMAGLEALGVAARARTAAKIAAVTGSVTPNKNMAATKGNCFLIALTPSGKVVVAVQASAPRAGVVSRCCGCTRAAVQGVLVSGSTHRISCSGPRTCQTVR